VTLIKFGTPSNIYPKRITLQTRNLAHGCIRTICPKWPINISVKGRDLGHVTAINLADPQTYLQNVLSDRLEIWHTDACGQFLQNARI